MLIEDMLLKTIDIGYGFRKQGLVISIPQLAAALQFTPVRKYVITVVVLLLVGGDI